jgi:ribonucleoside-diphosphate reductase alpha chain
MPYSLKVPTDRYVSPEFKEELQEYLDTQELFSPKFTEDAIRVLTERYLLRDDNGDVVESPTEIVARIALFVAKGNHSTACAFYDLIAACDFMPNSPTLMNAGTKIGNLSACFVVPVTDSLSDIYEGVKSVALIHQSGGGTGMDFSRLRQKGAKVKSTSGVASGPISFMEVYNASTEAVKQGGKRRGANMFMLRCDHPDIIEFIKAKTEEGRLTNANISVAITDKFITALSGNRNTEGYTYAILDPKTGNEIDRLDARDVWNIIIENAWKSGDPGIVFIDKINEYQPFDIVEHPEHIIRATNPCGEQPLEDYEACNLGSINLAHMILPREQWEFDYENVIAEKSIDWEKLRRTVATSVTFLDNVIDVSSFPLPQIDSKVKENRKIGLGVMGWADMLIEFGITYGSEKSYELAGIVMSNIQNCAIAQSNLIADERGPYPTWSISKSASANPSLPMRNATVTTIAPTGTISMIASCSSGIEPLFALSFTKTVMDGKKFYYIHPCLEELNRQGAFYPEDWHKLIANGQLPDSLLNDFPYLVTAHDVSLVEHVLMQSAFQLYTQNAVSKTVNLPNDTTMHEIDSIFRLAYESYCRGITVFRDGCKNEQVLTTGTNTSTSENIIENPTSVSPVKPRPESLWGPTVKIKTPCGNLYVTITEDENGQPMEVFAKLGKSGGCPTAIMETTGRLVSNMLRSGTEVDHVIRQLRGVSCGQQCGMGPNKVTSCQDAIGIVLQRYESGQYHQELADEVSDDYSIDNNELPNEALAPKLVRRNGACPECGGPIEHEGGCAHCVICGYSKCA